MFYTTSISILKNKQQDTYKPINLHCDFEIGISNAAKKVFPNINIKYCVWHYKRSLEKQKNELCYNEKNPYCMMITKGELMDNGKKNKNIKTDEIDNLIKYCRNMESELNDKEFNRNDIIELWYNCLIDLNNKNNNSL
ncbi:hypothetical protein PIROE2DRAFT_17651 [Piromyces sp. E2]|nr:hypothetical protein PIROE2DRAFT_17651 [Piromyces sp. E2]|eukprot:OUM57389.1 hypothetical protein PIROE2DRAFT_17651 [Piromyces sp. E2]